jgi:uncharacterized membrane protein
MEQYIVLAFISTFFFGLNAIILKSAKNLDPVALGLISTATAAIFIFIYWFFFFSKKQFSPAGIKFGVLSGAAYAIGLILFIMAVKAGKVSIVAGINALSTAVAVILAIIVFSEKLTAIKIGGIILGIIAAVLLAI